MFHHTEVDRKKETCPATDSVIIRWPGTSVLVTVTPWSMVTSVTSRQPTRPARSFLVAADCMMAAGPPLWVWPKTTASAVCIIAASCGAMAFKAMSPETSKTSPYLMGSRPAWPCSGLRGWSWLVFPDRVLANYVTRVQRQANVRGFAIYEELGDMAFVRRPWKWSTRGCIRQTWQLETCWPHSPPINVYTWNFRRRGVSPGEPPGFSFRIFTSDKLQKLVLNANDNFMQCC